MLLILHSLIEVCGVHKLAIVLLMLDQPKMDFQTIHLGVGHFLVIGSSDRPHISYFDKLSGKFKQLDKLGHKVTRVV